MRKKLIDKAHRTLERNLERSSADENDVELDHHKQEQGKWQETPLSRIKRRTVEQDCSQNGSDSNFITPPIPQVPVLQTTLRPPPFMKRPHPKSLKVSSQDLDSLSFPSLMPTTEEVSKGFHEEDNSRLRKLQPRNDTPPKRRQLHFPRLSGKKKDSKNLVKMMPRSSSGVLAIKSVRGFDSDLIPVLPPPSITASTTRLVEDAPKQTELNSENGEDDVVPWSFARSIVDSYMRR